jgi:hypothetical protein
LVLTHDSFLDVVSNVVGVLVLVAIAVIINSGEIQIALGAPVLREPPAKAERVVFECSRGQVFRLDTGALFELWQEYAGRESERTGRKLDPGELTSLFEHEDVGNERYRIRIPPGSNGVQQYELRADAVGENALELADSDSDYQRELQAMNGEDHWIWFIVRNDSFETFRAARQLARARGLAVGWGPRATGEPIGFSAEGGEGSAAQW